MQKHKIASAASGASSLASILGSWQICHNLCLGLITILALVGITLNGMPLLFFTKIAIPMWIIAVALLVVVLYFYFKRNCISTSLLLVNIGLIIAGTPDKFVGSFQIYFWIVGALTIAFGVIIYFRRKK